MRWMPRLCWSCLAPGSPSWRGIVRLCPACLARLHLARFERCLSVPSGLTVAAPFRYQGLAREVVLRTKVDGDQRALALIEEALATSPPVVRLLRSSDLLMPCPSSLWGRWRGRLDIPGCAAVRLAAEHRLPLVPAPPWLFWRWRKRALHHQADSPPTRYSPPSTKTANQWRAKLTRFGRSEALRIVLVDDVVTSGATLAELAAALGEQGFYVTQAITFACAPRLAHAATAANEPEFRCND